MIDNRILDALRDEGIHLSSDIETPEELAIHLETALGTIALARRLKPAPGQRELSWDESEHPRGQPGNVGQFASSGSGGSSHKDEPTADWSAPAESVANQLIRDLRSGKVGDAQVAPEHPADPREDYKKNGTRAKAFKAWFGDWEADTENASKVVNDEGEPQPTAPIEGKASRVRRDGKPIAVYHGTKTGGFKRFMKSKLSDAGELLYGPGFYFTEDPSVADEYAGAITFGVSHHPTREAAEEAIEKRSEEWRKTYGDPKRNGIEDLSFKVKKEPGQTGDFAYLVEGRGYYPAEQRLKSQLNGADLTTLEKHFQQIAKQYRKAGDNVAGAQYELLATATKGSPQTIQRFLLNPAPTRSGLEDDHKRHAAEALEKIGNAIVSDQRERKEVYLNIRKPFDIDGAADEADLEAAEKIIGKDEADPIWRDSSTGAEFYSALAASVGKSRANEVLAELGYDGITHVGGHIMGGGHEHRVWIAFEPTQIKATDNEGTFDPENDHIALALKPGRGQKSIDFDEAKVNRDDDGKFAPKGEASAAGAETPAAKPVKRDDAVPEGKVRMRQAKAGGEVSEVDGKLYKGGSWMPVHGLFSGQQKPEKKPLGQEFDGAVPVANPDRQGAPIARQLSPEQVESERKRMQFATEFQALKAGPIGKIVWFGDRPHMPKGTQGNLSWQAWAIEQPPDRLQHVETVAKELALAALKQKYESDQMFRRREFDKPDELSIEEATERLTDHVEKYDATGNAEYFKKGHLKKRPGSALTYSWVGRALDAGGWPAYQRINEAMQEKIPDPRGPVKLSMSDLAAHLRKLRGPTGPTLRDMAAWDAEQLEDFIEGHTVTKKLPAATTAALSIQPSNPIVVAYLRAMSAGLSHSVAEAYSRGIATGQGAELALEAIRFETDQP